MDVPQSPDPSIEVRRGRPAPLGATVLEGGVNFAVYARHATSLTLVLYRPGASEAGQEFKLSPRFNRTGDIWHAFLAGAGPGMAYAYRAERRPHDRPEIHRYHPPAELVDPYARALSGGTHWGRMETRPSSSCPSTSSKSATAPA